LGVGRGLTTPHRKTLACYEIVHRASDLVILEAPKDEMKKMRWVRHVACLGAMRNTWSFKTSVSISEVKRPLGRLGLSGKIILKRIFK
jgi:hypothetical protein